MHIVIGIRILMLAEALDLPDHLYKIRHTLSLHIQFWLLKSSVLSLFFRCDTPSSEYHSVNDIEIKKNTLLLLKIAMHAVYR
jgi:hypothetical protein